MRRIYLTRNGSPKKLIKRGIEIAGTMNGEVVMDINGTLVKMFPEDNPDEVLRTYLRKRGYEPASPILMTIICITIWILAAMGLILILN